MTIEINEKPTRDYYAELVCVSRQFKDIQKNPHAKIKDMVPTCKILSIVGFVVAVIFAILFAFQTGASQILSMIAVCIFALIFVMSRILIKATTRALDAHETNYGPSTFTMDENGVSLDKENGISGKISWGELLCVLAGEHAMIFVPKKVGLLVSLPVA